MDSGLPSLSLPATPGRPAPSPRSSLLPPRCTFRRAAAGLSCGGRIREAPSDCTSRLSPLSTTVETMSLILALVTLALSHVAAAEETLPPYIHQCRWSDPKVSECFIHAMMHIRPWLAQGIPEIDLPASEPFRLNELSLSLTTGPNGYRVNLKDINLYGASNFTVARLRLSERGAPFDLQIRIPQLRINADYTSSGVLIIIPASGKGSFHSTLTGVHAVMRGTASKHQRDHNEYLHVDKLNVDLKIKEVNMGIKRAFNNNAILTEATNLFLRSNGHEVLEAMMPQLRTKLAEVFMNLSNRLLAKVPVQHLVRE